MAQLQEFPGIEAGGRNRSIPLGTTNFYLSNSAEIFSFCEKVDNFINF